MVEWDIQTELEQRELVSAAPHGGCLIKKEGTGICSRDERLIQPHIAYTDAPERCGMSHGAQETKGDKTVETCVMPVPRDRVVSTKLGFPIY